MRRQLRRAASSGKLPGSREACYFLPRGGGLAVRVRGPAQRPNNDSLCGVQNRGIAFLLADCREAGGWSPLPAGRARALAITRTGSQRRA